MNEGYRHQARGNGGLRKVAFPALTAVVLAFTFPAEAQLKKLPKIGWLGTTSDENATTGGRETLRRELPKLGYVEGKSIEFEYRSAANNSERFLALADDLVGLKVDVIVAPSTLAALAAQKATKTIPIVFMTYLIPSRSV
jgi:putative ABC transport system substrate-binding protein